MCNRSERLSLWILSITLTVMGVFWMVFSRPVGRPIAGPQLKTLYGTQTILTSL